MVPRNATSVSAGLTNQLRVCQILVLALCVGAIASAIVLSVLAGWPQPADQPWLAYGGMLGGGLAIVGRFIARLLTDRQSLRLAETLYRRSSPQEFQQSLLANPPQDPAGDVSQAFFQLFQNQLIFSMCMLESGVFLNLVAYFLQKQAANLVVAGILIAYMLLHMPTLMTYHNWTHRLADRAIRRVRQTTP